MMGVSSADDQSMSSSAELEAAAAAAAAAAAGTGATTAGAAGGSDAGSSTMASAASVLAGIPETLADGGTAAGAGTSGGAGGCGMGHVWPAASRAAQASWRSWALAQGKRQPDLKFAAKAASGASSAAQLADPLKPHARAISNHES